MKILAILGLVLHTINQMKQKKKRQLIWKDHKSRKDYNILKEKSLQSMILFSTILAGWHC